ncbi:MAG: FtsX-like permease family protein [Pirellulaceae bacterium]|nr:FtsX-like permease family protein [Planctomycetales bacterium]
MRITRLALREIRHRHISFLLGLVSVAVATACWVGAEVLLKSDALQTVKVMSVRQQMVEQAIDQKRQVVEQSGKALQDEIRKQMLQLGFNVLIVPQQQDLSRLHLDGVLTETMPESYVDKLANSQIVTVNHLLPSVTGRVALEHAGSNLDVLLQGTRGEVPIMHRDLKKPLLEAVPAGTVVVGYDVHTTLGLHEEDTLHIGDREFRVSKLHPQRGSSDDVTVWIDLGEAQQLLGLANVIHAILALECECAGDRISQIREEISKILPGTKVIERYSQAVARAEARQKAKQTAEQALELERENGALVLVQEKQLRDDLQQRHANLARVVVPLALVCGMIWVAALAYGNVRDRRAEIGVLRAIGVSTNQVLMLFLSRAVAMGMLGGLLGAVLGVLVGIILSDTGVSGGGAWHVLGIGTVRVVIGLALVLAPAMAAVASWIPAVQGSRCDPADVLQTG